MDILAMLFMTVLILSLMIGACRILSMTFKTYSRSITIKNRKLAEKTYLAIFGWYYIIAMLLKINEANQRPRSKLTGYQSCGAASCGVFDPRGIRQGPKELKFPGL